jgi:hypothetical protein
MFIIYILAKINQSPNFITKYILVTINTKSRTCVIKGHIQLASRRLPNINVSNQVIVISRRNMVLSMYVHYVLQTSPHECFFVVYLTTLFQ